MRKTYLLLSFLFITLLFSPQLMANSSELKIGDWVFEVQGTDTDATAKIFLPQSTNLTFIAPDGTATPTDSLEFTKIQWINSSTIRGFNDTVRYQIKLSNHIFDGEGATFDGRILILHKLWVKTPEPYWYNMYGELFEENQRFYFADVRITPEGKVKGGYFDRKVNSSVLSYWLLNLDHVRLTDKALEVYGDAHLNCNLKTFRVPFVMYLDEDLLPRKANFLQAFPYDIVKEGLLTIDEAYLNIEWLRDPYKNYIPADSLITVTKANFYFYERTPEVKIELGNFTIDDLHVIIAKSGDFYINPIPFNIDGIPHIYRNYWVRTGSSGILGWMEVETSHDTVKVTE